MPVSSRDGRGMPINSNGAEIVVSNCVIRLPANGLPEFVDRVVQITFFSHGAFHVCNALPPHPGRANLPVKVHGPRGVVGKIIVFKKLCATRLCRRKERSVGPTAVNDYNASISICKANVCFSILCHRGRCNLFGTAAIWRPLAAINWTTAILPSPSGRVPSPTKLYSPIWD